MSSHFKNQNHVAKDTSYRVLANFIKPFTASNTSICLNRLNVIVYILKLNALFRLYEKLYVGSNRIPKL